MEKVQEQKKKKLNEKVRLKSKTGELHVKVQTFACNSLATNYKYMRGRFFVSQCLSK